MKRKKLSKPKRRKAGYREKNRICALCDLFISKDQALVRHHLSYKQNFTVSLHWLCHEIVHGRLKYRDQYVGKFGIDFGPYQKAKDIVDMYERYPNIKKEIEETVTNKLEEINDELSDPKAIRNIQEGRAAINAGAKGVPISKLSVMRRNNDRQNY